MYALQKFEIRNENDLLSTTLLLLLYNIHSERVNQLKRTTSPISFVKTKLKTINTIDSTRRLGVFLNNLLEAINNVSLIKFFFLTNFLFYFI